MLETFTQSTFLARLGETFCVHDDSPAPLEIQLTDVMSLGSADGEQLERRAPFSILFQGPADALLAQRIYTISHEAMGTFELFLVPLGPAANGLRYEAVFA